MYILYLENIKIFSVEFLYGFIFTIFPSFDSRVGVPLTSVDP